MAVRSTGRLALLLLIVPLVLFQCVGEKQVPPPPPQKCPPANEKRYKPEIKVDVSNKADIKASPRVAVIWEVEPEDPNAFPPFKPSKNRVKIKWTASDPNFKLGIRFTTKDCVIDDLKCDTPGECTAKVKTFPTQPPNTRCTYEMYERTNPAVKDEDADIIVMPCCS